MMASNNGPKMASKSAKFANVCPVCLETRPLKIAGRCKHSFCSECLMITLGSQKGDVFACPTCKMDCPRPWDGVKGMVDFTGEDVAGVDIDSIGKKGSRPEKKEMQRTGNEKGAGLVPNQKKGVGKAKRTMQKSIASITMDVKCTICHHKKKEVQAVNLCVECGNLHICEECTKVHARNKATRGHVVVRFRSETKQQESTCEKHDSLLSSYCHECGEEVCMVCVMLDHGDHAVEKLADVVDARLETLGVILEERERELRELQGLKCELTVLEGETVALDKQDILIKEIEDHAQKCIDQVVRWKEGLKEHVKTCFSIVRDIPTDLKKVSEVVEKLKEPIGSAAKLLSKTDRCQINLNDLISTQRDLEATIGLGGDIQRSGHLYQLSQLRVYDYCFIPDEINTSFGSIDTAEATPVYYEGEFPVEIFKQTVTAASEDMYIPCVAVANLGKNFAVAHQAELGEPSMTIDIYEFSGTLKRTFKDHVPPLYDMSSTPNGDLAVLSDGTGGTGCCVKLFDAETGYVSSTRDIDVAAPLSLGVTIRHQYVILGDNEQGQNVITVVDKDGVVECSLEIDKDFPGLLGDEDMQDIPYANIVGPPVKITCGGMYIFVIGHDQYATYAINDGELQLQATYDYREGLCDYLTDISADLWGDHILSVIDANEFVVLEKWVANQGNILQGWWPDDNVWNVEEPDYDTRISGRDGHIVLSRRGMIQVFKE